MNSLQRERERQTFYRTQERRNQSREAESSLADLVSIKKGSLIVMKRTESVTSTTKHIVGKVVAVSGHGDHPEDTIMCEVMLANSYAESFRFVTAENPCSPKKRKKGTSRKGGSTIKKKIRATVQLLRREVVLPNVEFPVVELTANSVLKKNLRDMLMYYEVPASTKSKMQRSSGVSSAALPRL